MNSKRILILSHTGAHSKFKIGSHHYANKLASLGYEVYYSGVPVSCIHKILRRGKSGSIKTSKNVKLYDLGSLLPITFRNLFINRWFNNIFWRVTERSKKAIYFDFVICDYPYFYPLLSYLNFGKVVYRPTDDYLAMSGKKVESYERKIIQLADYIICTSEVVKSNLLLRYEKYISRKIHVIENGYDSELFNIQNENERSGCVYVGALDDRFSFDDIKTLAQQFIEVQFDIYGPFEERDKKVIELMKNKNVKFKGSLEYEDVASVLNKYKIGILPLVKSSKNEGRSPMKLWEYYSCGLNVVYTNISHIKNDVFFEYNNESLADISDVFNKALYYKRQNHQQDELLLENTWGAKVKKIIDITHINL